MHYTVTVRDAELTV